MHTLWYDLTITLRTILTGLLLLPVITSADASEPLGRNVIFVLSDDHRHDFMGFHPKSPDWLDTPAMDRMAREGVHFANAFVSTSLCSPSRAFVVRNSRILINRGVTF